MSREYQRPRGGPPRDDDGAPHHQDAVHSRSSHAATPTTNNRTRQRSARTPYGTLAGNARRREQALRSAPLGACGCVRDPAHDQHRCESDELSPRMLDAARDAGRHILNAGCTPILPSAVLRALWRRDSADRGLALLLHRMSGGES